MTQVHVMTTFLRHLPMLPAVALELRECAAGTLEKVTLANGLLMSRLLPFEGRNPVIVVVSASLVVPASAAELLGGGCVISRSGQAQLAPSGIPGY
jgi:hypothetical protein